MIPSLFLEFKENPLGLDWAAPIQKGRERASMDPLMIAFQFSLGSYPTKTLGCDGLKLSVDRSCEMTVFPGKAKAEDLLQIHKATDDFFPLLLIDRLHQAALVLGLSPPAFR